MANQKPNNNLNKRLLPSFKKAVPAGDDKLRSICNHCDHIAYENPKIIVKTVTTHNDKILMVKRAIPPRVGYWDLPGGYMENSESAEKGAARETLEEAGSNVAINALLAAYSVPHISQVHLIYRATLVGTKIKAGVESQDAKLFDYDDIPWKDIAFPSSKVALEYWKKTKDKTDFQPQRKTFSLFTLPKVLPFKKPPYI